MIPEQPIEPAEKGTAARRQQIIDEMEYLKKELDSVFAAVNPKVFEPKAKRLSVLEDELSTYYNDQPGNRQYGDEFIL